MATVRITLEEPFENSDQYDLELKFGYEVIVPMNFGAQPTAESMNTFTRGNDALPAVPRVWKLSWRDESRRAALVPIDVAMHYFGDWRASSDLEAVRSGRVPSINNERERVAKVWGDFQYSNQHGLYSTVRIDTPRVPKVVIQNANENGATVGEWAYRPWDFFKFEEQLDPKAAQYRKAQRAVGGIVDVVSALSEEQILQLADILEKRQRRTTNAKGA